jgi:hypothetical protein
MKDRRSKRESRQLVKRLFLTSILAQAVGTAL